MKKIQILICLILVLTPCGQGFSQSSGRMDGNDDNLTGKRDEREILAENMKRLDKSKGWDRIRAIERLSGIRGKDSREKAGKALTRRLKKEKDSGVKGQLIKTLSRMKYKGAGGAVLTALSKEKNTNLRTQMINALGNLEYINGKGALKKLLNSKKEIEVLYSASALAAMGDNSGLGVLEKVALDKSKKRGNRSMAIRSLGGIKDEKAVDILGKLLEDEDFAIRLQAVSALGRLGGDRAEDLILKMRDDPDERVSRLAENILKKE